MGDLNDVGKPLLYKHLLILFMARRNRLFKNSIAYQQYINGLNSRLDRIKSLKEKHKETGVISWILLREITEINQFLQFYKLKLNDDWYEQL